MKITLKSRLKSIIILSFIIVASFSMAMWEIFGLGNMLEAGAATNSAAAIASAINGAEDDWKTRTEIEVGNETDVNGAVVTIGDSAFDESAVEADKKITVPQGAQVTIDALAPSVQRELENGATYSQLVFDVPVTISKEAVLTVNCDVVFKKDVTVNGTLIIGGMAFNRSAMTIANVENSYAEIKSEGVIVKGSLNNDGARGGSITVNKGASLTIAGSTASSYNDGSETKTFSNNDGGALFLKADGSNSSAITGTGTLVNNGSIIYDSNITTAPGSTGTGAVVSAEFINEILTNNTSSGTYVYYDTREEADQNDVYALGTTLSISNTEGKTWSNVTLLSFGRTIIKNGSNNVSYSLTNVNLGGGTSGGKTFTQGANELIFDGGAEWTQTTTPTRPSGHITSAITDLRFYIDNGNELNYINNSGSNSNTSLLQISGSGNTVSMYSGVKILRQETRAGSGNGGGIGVKNEATLIMYGGEIKYNAVTQSSNDGTGGGIYIDNAEVEVYNGKISNNALATYLLEERNWNLSYKWTYLGSADGAGIAVDSSEGDKNSGSTLTMFGGEVSNNHGATGSAVDPGADGGGMIARYSTIYMYGGSISNNYAGGSGGGILLWNSSLTMTGGEISNNRAGFGGGIGMTSDNSPRSTISVSGGNISGNQAFENEYISTTSGYGGGICVGSAQYPINCFATFSGDAIVSENSAVYGGGLAVYTDRTKGNYNTLTMSGGTVTNNTADQKSYGSGVYVTSTSTISGALLDLSGNASIDSSNNVSFAIPTGSSAAPIKVSGALTGSGLAALVYLNSPGSWTNNNIVSYSNGATADRNKFLLDDTDYTFYEDRNYFLKIRANTNQDAVAWIDADENDAIGSGETYSTLQAAVDAVATSGTQTTNIYILKTASLSSSVTVNNKNVALLPYNGEDITLGVASDFTVSSVGGVNALFLVSEGGSLTIGGSGAGKLALDGNKSAGKDMAMVYVASGSFTLGENATLRNNNSSGNAGALYLGQDNTATISGTITDTSGKFGAIYVETRATLGISGAKFTGNCANSAGQNYAVYAVGNGSIITLGGDVNFGSNAIYTENKVVLGDNFRNVNATGDTTTPIGVSFPASRTAGTTIVDIPLGFVEAWKDVGGNYTSAADYADKQFDVVNMDTDYMLIVSTEATDVANALVVSKSVVFVFDFTYSNGFGEDIKLTGVEFADLKTILDNYTTVAIDTDKIRTRGNLVVLELQSGTNFPLDAFAGYASYSGYSLIRWEVNGVSTSYDYNGRLAYLDSETEVSVRSVWVENTYNITFDTNAAQVGNGVTFGGTMQPQEIKATSQTPLKPNTYTLVGYKFTGWNTQAGGDGTSIADGGTPQFTQMTSGEPDYTTTVTDGVSRITGAVYNITLYARWECIFAGGGLGTSSNPFIIADVNDLYILEATVNGEKQGTDKTADYSALEGYYNSNGENGAATYTAESYEGYYFKLSGSFDNTTKAFTGVIGRISGADHVAQEANVTKAIYGDNGATTVGDGAAAGTPFKGSFDGSGKTIQLNINKQKAEGYDVGASVPADAGTDIGAYINGDETLVGAGLFGYTDHATITNVTLAGFVHGYSHVGGLVGYAFGGNISSVTNTAKITSGGHDVGGVIGTFFELPENYLSSVVTDMANKGSVEYAPRERTNRTELVDYDEDWNELEIMADAEGVRFGGVVGAGITLRLTGGYNTGDITARYGVGGVVGTLRSQDNSTTNDSFISQSFNSGAVTATAGLYATSTSPNGYKQNFITAYLGGITGRLVGRSSVNTSFNSGSVTSVYAAKVGGEGVDALEYVGMSGVPATGSTAAQATYIGARGVGGIVGFTSYDTSSTSQSGRMAISDVYNTGSITSFAGVGGIVGYLAYGNVSEAFNGGNVTAYGTHYSAEKGSYVAGGYELAFADSKVYTAFLGAIVGRGINALLTATVSYNMNSTYKGYTDATVQAIGDSDYNAQFGFGENSSSAKGLTSAQMRVNTKDTAPSGFDPTFDGGSWSFKTYTEGSTGSNNYSYYPQLKVFVNAADKTIGGTQLDIVSISKESAQIKYRKTDESGDEVDEPVTDETQFTLTFNLGGGSFNFDGGDDDSGRTFDGKEKKYRLSDADDYYYWFTFPTDTVDYDGGVGTTKLEKPVDPVRTGYTFGGWYMDAGCTREFSFDAIPGQNTTIYAKWNAVVYTITYENVVGVGGSWSGDYNKTFSIETAGSSLPAADNLNRRGYEFVGWKYTGIDGYITKYIITSGSAKPVIYLYNSEGQILKEVYFSDLTEDTLVLTAEWRAKEYKITYEPDLIGGFVDHGNATLVGQQTTYNIASADITLPVPEKLGYTFTGWQLVSIDGQTTIVDEVNSQFYKIGNTIERIRNNTVGDFVLQATWERNEITLYLDARGGTIADYLTLGLNYENTKGLYYKTVEYYSTLAFLFEGEGWKISTSGLVGKDFSGWYANANAEGNPVTSVDNVTVGSGSYTLYAGYKTKTHTLTISLGSANNEPVTVLDTAKDSLEELGFDFESGLTITVEHGADISFELSQLAASLDIPQSWYFDKWNVTDNGSVYNVTSAFEITAQYSQSTVTINFVGQNGDLIGTISVARDKSIAEDNTTKAAYDALLANEDLNVFGYTFNDKWTYSGGTFDENTIVTSSLVVYASFTPWNVNATFWLGGEETECVKEYTFGSAFGTFPSIEELVAAYNGEKTDYLGYKIDGIYLESDFVNAVNINTVISSDMWSEGESLADPLGLNLYVKISKDTYTINFNANGGNFGGSETAVSGTYQYGESVSWGASSSGFPTPSRKGYSLNHWYISGSNALEIGRIGVAEGKDYAEALFALLKEHNYVGTVNAIAYWSVEKYDVWFYAGDDASFVIPEEMPSGVTFYDDTAGNAPVQIGTATYCVVSTEYGKVPSIPATVSVRREGYTFGGWLTSGGAAVTAVYNDSTYTSSSPIEARWEVGKYSIIFITNGGNAITDITGVDYGKTLSAILPEPVRTGYEFGGWWTDSALETARPETMPAYSLVLYAKWTPVTSTLTLTITLPSAVEGAGSEIKTAIDKALGGSLTANATSADNIEYVVSIADVPYATSLAGLNSLAFTVGGTTYVIDGMWQNGGAGVVLDTMPEKAMSVGASFKAKTSESVITVTFYLNDGTQTVYYTLSGTGTVVTSGYEEILVPKREGYTFSGWWTDKVSGDKFMFGDVDVDTALYAHWEVNKHTVTLILNGGTGTTTVEDVPFGSDLTAEGDKLLPPPTRDGYTFDGWYIDSTCKVEADKMPDRDLTLYAKWTAVKYQLIFKIDGVTSSEIYEIGALINYPDATKKYYTFEGWYVAGGDVRFVESTMPNLEEYGGVTSEGVVTLTIEARNVPVIYSVEYLDGGEVKGTLEVSADKVASSVETALEVLADKTGYKFVGWKVFYGNTGGEHIYTGYKYGSNDETGVKGIILFNGTDATGVIGFEYLEGIDLIAVYEAETYTVTLNANGGEVSPTEITVTYDAIYGDKLIEPTRKGYTFAGWWTENGSTSGNWGTQVTADTTVSTAGIHTLYAQWNANKYLVIFDPNGGAVSPTYKTVTFGQPYGTLPEPARDGYKFAGWYTDKENATLVEATDTVQTAGIHTLYAHWSPIKTTIKFVGGDGTGGSMNELTLTYGGSVELTSNGFTKVGYHFLGWATQSGGSVVYVNGATVSNIAAGELTLYAVWKENTYTVVFNGNGNTSGSMDAMSFTYGETKPLSANAFTKTGYTFLGWSTESVASSVKYENQDEVSNLTDVNGATVTLYAVWKANTYEVVFNGNGADNLDAMSSQSFTYDVEEALSANKFEKTGYHFLGWATSQGATVAEYSDGQKVRNLVAQVNGTYTLYAVWEINTYTVTFDSNGGSAVKMQSVQYGKTANEPDPAPTKTGYTFVGWYSGETPYDFGAVTADITLTAKWKVSTFNVTFNAGDGQFRYEQTEGSTATTTSITLTVEYGGNAYAALYAQYDKLEVIAPENHHVLGFGDNYSSMFYVTSNLEITIEYSQTQVTVYMLKPDGTLNTVTVNVNGKLSEELLKCEEEYQWVNLPDKEIVTKDTVITQTQVITLVLADGQQVEVTFNANGGTVSPTYTTVTFGQAYGALPVLTREGYTFAGWWTEDGASGKWGTQVTADTRVTTGNHTLFAKWTPNTYTVVFNGNGGTGTMGAMSFTYDVAQNLTANAFTRNGYTFLGWSANPYAGEVTYVEQGEVSNLTAVDGATVTLYAVWKANTYEVVFNGNGVTPETERKEVTFGNSYGSLEVLTREGYTFLGWWTENGASGDWGTLVTADTIVSTVGTHTLYARWQAIEYHVYFFDGETLKGSDTYTVGAQVDKIDDPEKTGYTFVYWSVYDAGQSKYVEFKFNTQTMPAADLYLYAQWQINTYTVSLNGTNVSGNGAEKVEHGAAYTYTLTAAEGYNLPASVTITMGSQAFTDFTYSNGVIIIESGKITDDLVITAKGTIKQYTVTFDSNGGSAVDVQKVEHGKTASMPDPAPTKEGYTFVGWYLGEKEYDFETEVTADIALTAKWEAASYTVTLDENYAGGNSFEITVTYDEIYGDKLTAPTREGYTFLGWWTEDGASGDWGTLVTADTIVSTANAHTLYARWQINSYDITLSLTFTDQPDDATVNAIRAYISDKLLNRATVTCSDNVITVTLTRQYGASLSDLAELFVESYSEITIGGQPYFFVWENAPSGALGVGSATFSGKWTNDSVRTVTVNDGEEIIATYYVTRDGSGNYTFDLDGVSVTQRAGSVFIGWSADGNGQISENTLTITGASVTVTAKWQEITYTVTYSGDGVSLESISFRYDGEKFTLVGGGNAQLGTVNRIGYTFVGWKYNDIAVTTLSELFEKAALGYGSETAVSIELAAQFTPNEYSVTFNANGGSGAMGAQTITFGQATALNANAFVRAGYTFGGWTYGEDIYADGAQFTITGEMLSSGIELMAIWTENSYTIAYDTQDEAAVANFTQTVVLAKPESEGKTFLGWATESDGGVVYNGGATVSVSKLFTGLESSDERTLTLYTP